MRGGCEVLSSSLLFFYRSLYHSQSRPPHRIEMINSFANPHADAPRSTEYKENKPYMSINLSAQAKYSFKEKPIGPLKGFDVM